MTLAELLVSALVTLLAAGAALAAVIPLQRGFAAQPEAAGLAQRARVVSDVLGADLRRASLVLPYRVGDLDSDVQRGTFYRPDMVSVVAEPIGGVASGAVVPTDTRTYYLKQDSESIWQLMQYDGHASDQPAVEDVIALRLDYFGDPQPPLPIVGEDGKVRVTYGAVPPAAGIDNASDTWGAGENCTIAVMDGMQVPRLATLDGDALIPMAPGTLIDGPWCPDASHAFRFDADLLRVRRVRVEIRLQAARPFRGLAGALFQFAGTAGEPARYVPDETLTVEVTLRNANAAR